MNHRTVGISIFIRSLKEAMNDRISKFEQFVKENFNDDLEGVPSYSQREWTRKFRAWSISQDHSEDYNKIIKQYLGETHED